ncbi:hypothetical protein Pint_18402 [Pistacia integerrima]|uniref:Uncharacterized protein n=1 Tax=Pistacia integerrima TaxID=434235 RepID=A0ACC0YXZ0_9ROSI|nr:hypothetical protein Pint_18402 [Pistacia integerrima]
METELLKLKKKHSLKARNGSTTNDSDNDDDPRYTSLKDIISNSSPTSHATNNEGNYDFDSSNITIRNRLVKRAASAYIQSTTILVTRNRNYFANVWSKAKAKAQISSSCWNAYVKDPLQACFQPIYRFLASTVEVVWNKVTHMS